MGTPAARLLLQPAKAMGQGIEGRAPVVKRKLAIDARFHPVGQGPDGGLVLAALLGEPAAVFSGAHAHHREALDERQVDRQRRQAAGGEADLKERGLTAQDVVVGLSASGRTPYVLGALQYAAVQGAATISVCCSTNAPVARLAQIDLCVLPGPEVITGSTRMKAGTAQKMILNMLSTGAMIKLGKVYGNLMVDVKASNEKLQERACRIVMEATGCNRAAAKSALQKTGGRAKEAVVVVVLGVSAAEAAKRLQKEQGYLARVLNR